MIQQKQFSSQTLLAQELISYRNSSRSSCWGDLFKKPKAPSFQIRSGWNLAGMFFKQMRIDWPTQIL